MMYRPVYGKFTVSSRSTTCPARTPRPPAIADSASGSLPEGRDGSQWIARYDILLEAYFEG